MKLQYGWVVVGAGALMGCVAIGAVFSLAVFLQPMSDATGWSRTGVSSAMTIVFLTMGVAAFGWGALTDRFGPRIVVLLGALLLGLGLALASRATSLLEFQVVYGVIVGGAAGAVFAPLMATVTGWFDKHRSLAVSLVSAGMGAAPGAPADAAAGGAEMTAGQALRSPQFLVLALTYFCCCANHSGPIFHTVSYAIACGLPALAAVTIYSVEGLAGLGGRLLFGLSGDRFGAKQTLVVGLLIQAVAAGAYFFTRQLGEFYAVAVIFGLAYGGVMPLYAVIAREYFPLRIMGTVIGASSLVASLGMALGPAVGGWIYDTTGSYGWLYIGSFGIGLGAVAIALTFPPFPSRQRAVAQPA